MGENPAWYHSNTLTLLAQEEEETLHRQLPQGAQ